jgi:hypothetical protein
MFVNRSTNYLCSYHSAYQREAPIAIVSQIEEKRQIEPLRRQKFSVRFWKGCAQAPRKEWIGAQAGFSASVRASRKIREQRTGGSISSGHRPFCTIPDVAALSIWLSRSSLLRGLKERFAAALFRQDFQDHYQQYYTFRCFGSADGVQPESDYSVSVHGECFGRQHSQTTWGTVERRCLQPVECPAMTGVRSAWTRILPRRGATRKAANQVPWHPNSGVARWQPISLSLFDCGCPGSFPLNYIKPSKGVTCSENFHLLWIAHRLTDSLRDARVRTRRELLRILED